MTALENRLETPSNSPVVGICQNMTWYELLGQPDVSNQIPKGWERSLSLQLKIGTDCYVFQLRSRTWIKAIYHDYWERGRFAEVKAGDRILKVFSPEHLAVKI